MHILEPAGPDKTYTSLEVIEGQLTSTIASLSLLKEGLSEEKKENIDYIRNEICFIRNALYQYTKHKENKS